MGSKLAFKKILMGLIIATLVFSGIFIDTGYLTVRPGSAVLLEDMVEIESYPPVDGELYLLTVSQQKASPILYTYATLSKKVDLVRKEYVIPDDMDMDEYYQLSMEMMRNSQLKAEYVALTQAGFDAEITSEGVLVEMVLPDGSADGYLQHGDIIIEIDGEKVFFDEQVINIVREQEIGNYIEVKVMRNNEELNFAIPVGESQSVKGTPALGIMVRNSELNLRSELDIEIKANNIGGPSAGLMFVLEIYNRITDEDITNGMKIAGTGEIMWDGRVGPIGGMKQKVYAAEKEGADILFCPVENYDEAIAYATKIEVVKVNHFDDVVDYLSKKN